MVINSYDGDKLVYEFNFYEHVPVNAEYFKITTRERVLPPLAFMMDLKLFTTSKQFHLNF